MPKQQELDVKGDGVERLEIPIEKAIAKYQRKKDARLQGSPGGRAMKFAKPTQKHEDNAKPTQKHEDNDKP